MNVSKRELETEWSLDDCQDAHMALDVWDSLEWEKAEASRAPMM